MDNVGPGESLSQLALFSKSVKEKGNKRRKQECINGTGRGAYLYAVVANGFGKQIVSS